MPKYLALQIFKGKLEYDEVIEKFPQFADDINNELTELGYIFESEEDNNEGS